MTINKCMSCGSTNIELGDDDDIDMCLDCRSDKIETIEVKE